MLLLIAWAAHGCALCPRAADPQVVAAKNLIFNPDWTNIPPETAYRTDWPSTVAFSRPDETIVYEERIIDSQGASENDRDRHYRRFDSIRTGRVHR